MVRETPENATTVSPTDSISAVGGDPDGSEAAVDLELPSAAGTAIEGGAESGELTEERPFTVKRIRPKDLALAREDMRGRIAVSLVAILAFVVLASFVTVWVSGDLTPAMKDLLTVILAPIVTLVGSATGFYFGGRVGSDDKAGS